MKTSEVHFTVYIEVNLKKSFTADQAVEVQKQTFGGRWMKNASGNKGR
jgi:hypothetical protein